MEKTTLYCFPYAGGSASIYCSWQEYIDSQIHIMPIELAGRGLRYNELAYTNLNDAVKDVYSIITKSIHGPYGLFGHSMGSILAYELAHKINESDLPNPQYLFVSGRRPPHIERKRKTIHNLPSKEFMNKVMEMGGTPKEVFENMELLDVFLPIIREDFRIVENYRYHDRKPLDIDIISIYGSQESINDNEMKQWNHHTKRSSRVYKIEGNHFFINHRVKEIVNIVNDTVVGKRITINK